MKDNKKERGYDFAYRQIQLAVDILIRDILAIRSVTDWADVMGYSRAHFCRKFTWEFRENPKEVLRRAKFRKVCQAIQSDWSATAYKAALDSGFNDEKALHKFLNRNFGIGFVALKNHLKREAFKTRHLISRAADDGSCYTNARYYLLDPSAFPVNGRFKKIIPYHNNGQDLKPQDAGKM